MSLADFIKSRHPAAVAYRKALREGDEAAKGKALAELGSTYEQKWQKERRPA